MKEIIFSVEEAPEGGYTACALGESIFTQADTKAELHQAIQEAVHCHFDAEMLPKMVRLHDVHDEVLVAAA